MFSINLNIIGLSRIPSKVHIQPQFSSTILVFWSTCYGQEVNLKFDIKVHAFLERESVQAFVTICNCSYVVRVLEKITKYTSAVRSKTIN